MNYKNTSDSTEIVNFKTAVVQGIGRNKGLFVPESRPKLSDEFFSQITELSDSELAFQCLRPYIGIEDMSNAELEKICSESFNFPLPVHSLSDELHVLELFHGPTMAFKDVGARFMARCLGLFTTHEELTVLVATSGDTGSAVAQGFHNVGGVKVVIAFPKGKVSPFQEYQMTSLGGNILAVEIDGSFDDCQALVKSALQDHELKQKKQLSTANSINVARFLPQMVYYFSAVKQLKEKYSLDQLVVSVPSGNFGNITAGLYAQSMGLPIKRFVAANNANDTFYDFLQSGKYEAQASVSTFSNAMDVGDPSNFVRVQELFNHSLSDIKRDISGEVTTDDQTLETINHLYEKYDYILDPHGAVGFNALRRQIEDSEIGLVLATASPQKFETVIQKVIPNYPRQKVNLRDCEKLEIENDYKQYSEVIQSF